MTVIQAALIILKESGESLNAKQIYEKICDRNLYSFAARDPKAVVSAALRKASKGVSHGQMIRRNPDGTYDAL